MRLPPNSMTRPAGVLTVPLGVVEVCQAGVSRTEPQSNSAVPPRFGSNGLDALLADLAGDLGDRDDRRAGALGDGDGVADSGRRGRG